MDGAGGASSTAHPSNGGAVPAVASPHAERLARSLFSWSCKNCTNSNPIKPVTQAMLDFSKVCSTRLQQLRQLSAQISLYKHAKLAYETAVERAAAGQSGSLLQTEELEQSSRATGLGGMSVFSAAGFAGLQRGLGGLGGIPVKPVRPDFERMEAEIVPLPAWPAIPEAVLKAQVCGFCNSKFCSPSLSANSLSFGAATSAGAATKLALMTLLGQSFNVNKDILERTLNAEDAAAVIREAVPVAVGLAVGAPAGGAAAAGGAAGPAPSADMSAVVKGMSKVLTGEGAASSASAGGPSGPAAVIASTAAAVHACTPGALLLPRTAICYDDAMLLHEEVGNDSGITYKQDKEKEKEGGSRKGGSSSSSSSSSSAAAEDAGSSSSDESSSGSESHQSDSGIGSGSDAEEAGSSSGSGSGGTKESKTVTVKNPLLHALISRLTDSEAAHFLSSDPIKPLARDAPHPERPDRLRAIAQHLLATGLFQCCQRVPSRHVKREELEEVHTASYLDALEELPRLVKEKGGSYHFTSDTFANAHTLQAATLSCGSTLAVVEQVCKGACQRGVALVRPPGHHAEPDQAMGFCFYNNVAVAAAVARREWGAQRILILDWDVHHGNGIENMFYDDPAFLYVSLHRHEEGSFYPGTGHPNRIGEGKGTGYNVNVAWPEGGMGDAEYLFAFDELIMPVAQAFNPDLVLVSSGFDAARGDPLGGCDLTPMGYAHMTHRLLSLAQGKVVVVLEGGYNLRSISQGMEAVLRVLLGQAPPPLLRTPEGLHETEAEGEGGKAAGGRGGAGSDETSAGQRKSHEQHKAHSCSCFEPLAADKAELEEDFSGLSRKQGLLSLCPSPAAMTAVLQTMQHLWKHWPCLRLKLLGYQHLMHALQEEQREAEAQQKLQLQAARGLGGGITMNNSSGDDSSDDEVEQEEGAVKAGGTAAASSSTIRFGASASASASASGMAQQAFQSLFVDSEDDGEEEEEEEEEEGEEDDDDDDENSNSGAEAGRNVQQNAEDDGDGEEGSEEEQVEQEEASGSEDDEEQQEEGEDADSGSEDADEDAIKEEESMLQQQIAGQKQKTSRNSSAATSAAAAGGAGAAAAGAGGKKQSPQQLSTEDGIDKELERREALRKKHRAML